MAMFLELRGGFITMSFTIASVSLLGLLLPLPSADIGARTAEEPIFLAQANGGVSDILLKLPRPQGSPEKLGTMFLANGYQQLGLNFQTQGKPSPTLGFYRQALSKLNYKERPINTVEGDWGFSVVFDTPSGLSLTAKNPEKTVVLVIQGTMLGPDTINLNLRFEEI